VRSDEPLLRAVAHGAVCVGCEVPHNRLRVSEQSVGDMQHREPDVWIGVIGQPSDVCR
jgi:hypothetical protein